MQLTEALDFIRSRRQGTLVTIKRDGRPQLSNIVFAVDEHDIVRISVTADRAKTANLRRDHRASLYVSGDSFWSYVVVDAVAELSPVAAAADDETVEELVTLYRAVAGEHDDWADYRRAMVADRRLVVRLRPEHGYGILG